MGELVQNISMSSVIWHSSVSGASSRTCISQCTAYDLTIDISLIENKNNRNHHCSSVLAFTYHT